MSENLINIIKNAKAIGLPDFFENKDYLVIHYEYSYECNYSCWYCNTACDKADTKDYNPTTEHFKNFANNIKNNYPYKKMIRIIISGGEPLLKYKEILEFIDIFCTINSDKFVEIVVQTNLGINSEFIYKFKNLETKLPNSSLRIEISLHYEFINTKEKLNKFINSCKNINNICKKMYIKILTCDEAYEITNEYMNILKNIFGEENAYFIVIINNYTRSTLIKDISKIENKSKKDNLYIQKDDNSIVKTSSDYLGIAKANVFKGMFCLSGFFSIKIRSSGEILKNECSSNMIINHGVIYDKNVNFYNTIEECTCIREGYCSGLNGLAIPKISKQKAIEMNFNINEFFINRNILEKMNNSFSTRKKSNRSKN